MSIKDFKIRSLITHYRKNKRPTIGSIQRISSFLYFISSDLAVFNLKFLDYQIWALSSKWKYNYYIRLYKYVFPCQAFISVRFKFLKTFVFLQSMQALRHTSAGVAITPQHFCQVIMKTMLLLIMIMITMTMMNYFCGMVDR